MYFFPHSASEVLLPCIIQIFLIKTLQTVCDGQKPSETKNILMTGPIEY